MASVHFLLPFFMVVIFLLEEFTVAYLLRAQRIVNLQNIISETSSAQPPPAAMTEELQHLDAELAPCGLLKDIREMTLMEIQYSFRKRKLTSLQLTTCYIERIEKMNPYLKAVLQVNPDALKIALKSDYERIMGMHRGDLHGIPILLKDNIATADKMHTTSGSLALVGYRPRRDATVAARLRKAGAVILGKTNLSEFAYFRGSNIKSGWSGRGNHTLNCYVLHANPGGSSSGSAVATAANLCAASIGTETDGSIVSPAADASLVGLKPSLNLVPTYGVIPIARSQDVIGPMTRTVEDAGILMEAIGGENYTFQDNDDKLNPKPPHYNVGILREPYWEVNESDGILSEGIDILERSLIEFDYSPHVSIIDPVELDQGLLFTNFSGKEFTTLLHEFKHGMNEYLKTVRYSGNDLIDKRLLNGSGIPTTKIKTLKDIIEYNKLFPSDDGYNQQVLEMAEATDGVENRTYLEGTKENIASATKLLNAILDSNDLDAIATPWVGKKIFYRYSAIAGFPYVTVPAGFFNNGEACGIIFSGRMNSDKTLLEIAKEFEYYTLARRSPSFLP